MNGTWAQTSPTRASTSMRGSLGRRDCERRNQRRYGRRSKKPWLQTSRPCSKSPSTPTNSRSRPVQMRCESSLRLGSERRHPVRPAVPGHACDRQGGSYGSKAQEQAPLALKEGEPRQEACLWLRKANARLDGPGGIGDEIAARSPEASANSARRCGMGGGESCCIFPLYRLH